jgi:molybdopterin-guanine dinucleotide biosynthesis protein
MKSLLVAEYSGNGMPFVDLMDLFALPNVSHEAVVLCSSEAALLSDDMGRNPIELLHDRTAHCSKSVLIEGFKKDLFKSFKGEI